MAISPNSSAEKLVYAMYGVANQALSKEVSSIIKKHSIIGAICMALPFWGIETIVYMITLWTMYSSLSSKAQVPFKEHFFKNVLSGLLLNSIICLILGCILDFIPFLGWIGSAVLGYITTSVSGCGYLEVLAAIHGKDKVKERFNTSAAMNYLNNSDEGQEALQIGRDFLDQQYQRYQEKQQ